MPGKDDYYHSVLIVSRSEQLLPAVRQSIKGFITVESSKSAAPARRLVLERFFDLVLINAPLADETGVDFAIDVTAQCNASVLLLVPADTYDNSLDLVTDHGVMVLPKPLPRGRLEMALRYLIAEQNKIRKVEGKLRAAEEKKEELRIVSKAKFLLIEKKHLTEDAAHRLIGKNAMDNGISRAKAAQWIIDDLEEGLSHEMT